MANVKAGRSVGVTADSSIQHPFQSEGDTQMTRTDRTDESQPPTWRTPAIIGGVVILAIISGLLVAMLLTREPATGSADPTPSASPIPSVSASPSDAPAPSQTPSGDAPSEAPSAPAEPSQEPWKAYRDPVVANPDGVLPPGGVVVVTADTLRLREQATVDSPQRRVLGRGDLLVVGPTFLYPAFGPAEADGFTWYPVAVLTVDELPAPGGAPLAREDAGWVAVGDGQSEWLELLDPRCTDDGPTLQHLGSLTEWERLACYSDRQVTVEGVLGCGGCGGTIGGTFSPEWLAYPAGFDFLSVEPQDYIGPLSLRWPPDGPERPDEPGVAPILRVTGHFDDPAAAECRHTWISDVSGEQVETRTEPAISELFCRSNFVVESFEVIGEDEDFPFG